MDTLTSCSDKKYAFDETSRSRSRSSSTMGNAQPPPPPPPPTEANMATTRSAKLNAISSINKKQCVRKSSPSFIYDECGDDENKPITKGSSSSKQAAANDSILNCENSNEISNQSDSAIILSQAPKRRGRKPFVKPLVVTNNNNNNNSTVVDVKKFNLVGRGRPRRANSNCSSTLDNLDDSSNNSSLFSTNSTAAASTSLFRSLQTANNFKMSTDTCSSSSSPSSSSSSSTKTIKTTSTSTINSCSKQQSKISQSLNVSSSSSSATTNSNSTITTITTTTTTIEVLIPSWNKKTFNPTYRLEGVEDLTDDSFLKRHTKPEAEEKKIKRWDIRRQRQEHERMRLLKTRSKDYLAPVVAPPAKKEEKNLPSKSTNTNYISSNSIYALIKEPIDTSKSDLDCIEILDELKEPKEIHFKKESAPPAAAAALLATKKQPPENHPDSNISSSRLTKSKPITKNTGSSSVSPSPSYWSSSYSYSPSPTKLIQQQQQQLPAKQLIIKGKSSPPENSNKISAKRIETNSDGGGGVAVKKLAASVYDDIDFDFKMSSDARPRGIKRTRQQILNQNGHDGDYDNGFDFHGGRDDGDDDENDGGDDGDDENDRDFVVSSSASSSSSLPFPKAAAKNSRKRFKLF